jgi:hypothetical protein
MGLFVCVLNRLRTYFCFQCFMVRNISASPYPFFHLFPMPKILSLFFLFTRKHKPLFLFSQRQFFSVVIEKCFSAKFQLFYSGIILLIVSQINGESLPFHFLFLGPSFFILIVKSKYPSKSNTIKCSKIFKTFKTFSNSSCNYKP